MGREKGGKKIIRTHSLAHKSRARVRGPPARSAAETLGTEREETLTSPPSLPLPLLHSGLADARGAASAASLLLLLLLLQVVTKLTVVLEEEKEEGWEG